MLELARTSYDVGIVGAGPVGLALAIELARLGFATLVVDRRPPPDEDPGLRPQLLVARAGDLAHLAHLGLDTEDPRLVSLLAARTEGDLASGKFARGEVSAGDLSDVQFRPRDLKALAAQRPLALVPIGRLQRALLDEARRAGAEVVYACEVTKLRRHARDVSFSCGDTHVTADFAIVATGAARALVGATHPRFDDSPAHQLMGGVFDASPEAGHWTRLEVPLGGDLVVRATVLETTEEMGAGTALIVDAPRPDLLKRGFLEAARAHGLAGARFVSAPAVFATSVASVSHRFVGGDGRAPVVIAGDAAQTGHVFTGQTCFMNLALALGFAERLRHQPVLAALARYEQQSQLGAAILAERSARHMTRHRAGGWALAGVA